MQRGFRLAAVAFLVAVMALANPLAAAAAADDPAPAAVTAAAEASAPKKPPATKKPARKRPAKQAQPAEPTKAASVYLMRGFLGIFSLGLDRLDASLRAEGVKTRILGHTGWPGVVDEIAAEAALRPKNRAPVVIVGHSLGGNAALQAAYVLGQRGIPVDLVVTVDPTSSRPVSSVVKRYLNIYMSGDAFGAALAGSGTGVDNDDIRSNPTLNRPGVNHFTMDENPIVQQQILAAIMKVLGRKGKSG